MDIAMILHKIRPESSWSISENKYESLQWHDKTPKPTYGEVLEAWAEVEVEVANERASILRQKAYQKESDPLFFEYQRGNIEKEDWLAKVEEIKQRYPYTAYSQA
jgi:hypothetical protein